MNNSYGKDYQEVYSLTKGVRGDGGFLKKVVYKDGEAYMITLELSSFSESESAYQTVQYTTAVSVPKDVAAKEIGVDPDKIDSLVHTPITESDRSKFEVLNLKAEFKALEDKYYALVN